MIHRVSAELLGLAAYTRMTDDPPSRPRIRLHTLDDGQKVSFDIVADRRTGKFAAENLRAAAIDAMLL